MGFVLPNKNSKNPGVRRKVFDPKNYYVGDQFGAGAGNSPEIWKVEIK